MKFYDEVEINYKNFNIINYVIYKLSRPVLVQLWNRQCILIMNVACADFILATFGIFMPLVSSVHRQWIFGDLACSIYAFVTTLVGTHSNEN